MTERAEPIAVIASAMVKHFGERAAAIAAAQHLGAQDGAALAWQQIAARIRALDRPPMVRCDDARPATESEASAGTAPFIVSPSPA